MTVGPLIEYVTPDKNWYVILRPFNGEGDYPCQGEVVRQVGVVSARSCPTATSRRSLGASVPDAEGRRIVSGEWRHLDPRKKPARGRQKATKKQAASSCLSLLRPHN